ncbi:MAG TPA: GNAT family N-acetyltransferase [Chitinophagaceae bacterium]|nr:GNAT family N-acetyltransferase [Chitinophagaceae bacterium]
MYTITPYEARYKDKVANLVLAIQQKEFNLPVTLEGQPDLCNPETFYKNGQSCFWLAVEKENVIGSIGLLDIDNGQGVIRKMFVEKSNRGKDKAVAQNLYNTLEQHCKNNHINELFLGTINVLQAAQHFYIRNGFQVVRKDLLPGTFPVMSVDDLFFRKLLQ